MNTSQKAPPRPMVLLLVIFGAVDFFMPAMMRGSQSEVVGMFLVGMIAGQFSLLSIWAVLGPQPVFVRWPLTLLTAMGLLLIVVLGVIAVDGPPPDAVFVIWLFSWLPLMFLAAQSPLWIVKLLTGCRIVRATVEDTLPAEGSRQFDLRQMFAATAAIAVILTVARLSFYVDSDQYHFGGVETQMWLELLTACLVCAAWSAFVTIPCLGAVFVARNPTVGLIGVIVYASMVTCLIAFGMTWMFGSSEDEPAVSMIGLNAGSTIVLLCSLYLLRFVGYRLLWVRRKSVVVEGSSD